MEWLPYLFATRPVFDMDVFKRYEELLSVELPDAYKKVISEHQGDVPQDCLFEFDDQGSVNVTCMGPLFHYVENDRRVAGYNMLYKNQALRHRLPRGLVTFSQDPGGWPIAFDFRVQGETPIVLVDFDSEDMKRSVIRVAEGFEEFLSGLFGESDDRSEISR